MTMGDRIKSKRTLHNTACAADDKDAPTGGQPAPAESSRADGNKPKKPHLARTDPALS